MKILKEYKMTLITLVALAILYVLKQEIAVSSIKISLSSGVTMLAILPPILLIVNLLDAWVPREVITKQMGKGAGFKGYLWALALGTFAAGPLYAAFPVAALLAKKGAHISYIIFLLGVWTTTKLPIFLYELNFFGLTFTVIHVITGLSFFLLLSVLGEKVFLKNHSDLVYEKLSNSFKS